MAEVNDVHDPVEGPAHLHWRNLTAPLLLEVFWCTGGALAHSQIVIAAFLHELKASGLALGLTSVMMPFAAMCVQPFVAYHSLRIVRRKLWSYGLEGMASVCFLALGLSVLFVAKDNLLRYGVYLFFATYIPFFFFMNAGSSMYYGLLLDLTPKLKRGRLFGWRIAIIAGAGMLGGTLLRPLLTRFGMDVPCNYGVPFLFAGIAYVIGAHTLLLFDEKAIAARRPQKPSASFIHFWLDEIIPLLKERVFRRAMLMRVLMGVAFAGMTFLTVFHKDRLGMDAGETLSRFIFILFAAMMVGALINGRIADRIGHRFLMAVTCLCYAIAYLVPLMSGGLAYAFISFAVIGYANSAFFIGISPFIRELIPGHDSLKLVAISWFVPAPFLVAIQLLIGQILDWSGRNFMLVFTIALLSAILALCVCLFGLHEPRKVNMAKSGQKPAGKERS